MLTHFLQVLKIFMQMKEILYKCYYCSDLQLFRERLSEKVYATIPKGIVGGFEFTVLQRNLKELTQRPRKCVGECLAESNKSRFDSYSRQERCIDHTPYFLSGLSRAHFFQQPSRNSCIL